ncbi:MAG: beta-galactosidase trimerization domain-containing protein [Candidatus Saccharibacteria bacterium]|nr:beta-galactosidase trimerization domain-containing protein [Pseudorhodobacter sp.]
MPKPLRYRQIHLDFHTSEHIPGVGAAFDAQDFVATLQAAHVDSVTVFAKCHHGWCYYPTEVGAPHPGLTRDLLGEMITALNAADIEAPVYITVQWDERTARLHPEWRVRSAGANRFDPGQLQAGWHTICLNHDGARAQVLAQAREVMQRYPTTPGLFFDIVLSPDCVCAACLAGMQVLGLDPDRPEDRLVNDEWVNDRFRRELSEVLRAEYPDLRIFYNCGHIHKMGPERFAPYTHLELESLPTGGWGYDHFPSSARYAVPLGFDVVSHTGKFHTSWGEFGGFKHPDALTYEAAQMVALGSKCLVGDQLHPDGSINHDTYASIAPAYARVKALEPFLRGAVQVSEVAILAAEYFNPRGARNHLADDAAAQMLQELQLPFDVIDPSADFGKYRVLILPDEVRLDAILVARLTDYVAAGGKAILSDQSGLGAEGQVMPGLALGVTADGSWHDRKPFYAAAGMGGGMAGLPAGPFVVYGQARAITAAGAEVLALALPSYFNRTWAHFCSHQHAPDIPGAAAMGPLVTLKGGLAYIATPIFATYHASGQPLYRNLVSGLIRRFLPDPIVQTDMATTGRASVSRQDGRHILHLWHGAPTVRGRGAWGEDGNYRVMEMIEDVQSIGPVTARVRMAAPSRVYDAMTGHDLAWRVEGAYVAVRLDYLRIHAAVVFEAGV